MFPLAICTPPAGAERVFGIAIPLVGALLYVSAYLAAFRKRTELRGPLTVLFLLSGLAGAVIAATPGGFSDPDGDYRARFFTGVIVGAGMGLVVAVLTGRWRGALRFVMVGMLGGGAFIAWGIGVLIFGLAATGSCFG